MLKVSRFVISNLLANRSFQIQNAKAVTCSSLIRNNLVAAMNRTYAGKADKDSSASKGGKGESKGGQKQNLLRYPALPLNETIERFLKSVEPFLTPEEFENECKEIQVFLCCEGNKLQKLLEKAAAKEENWLADRWLRCAYLQYRVPVVIYSSPGQTFPRVEFCSDEEYLKYTASVIYCFLRFKNLVDTNQMPIQKMGKLELDNGQFGMVLGTCRIPNLVEDKITYNPNSKHLVVICKNNFYKLPVYAKNGKILHRDCIFKYLQVIQKCAKEEGTPFGILTTDSRDNWSLAYKDLCAIQGNKEGIKTIQTCLFTVSLDGELCFDPCESKNNIAGNLLIHGYGSKQYSANRWFDKTIQLVVCRSGFQGFTYEHSPAEGQPIAMMADYMIHNIKDPKFFETGETKDFEEFCQIKLKSSPQVDKHLQTATKNLDKLIGDFQLNVLEYDNYGKGFVKKHKMSPDSYVQMAMILAFFKLHREPPATYESAHLRVFRNGRTETIRSCSMETMDFIWAMYDPNTDQYRADMLRKAVDNHRKLTSLALAGKGVDRHLFGLGRMAFENRLPPPSIFSLECYKRSNHFRISSSQVASKNHAFMCYGAPLMDGYGCCYNPREDDIIVAVGSWRSNTDTCSQRYTDCLTEALDEMSCVLCRTGGEEKKPKSKM